MVIDIFRKSQVAIEYAYRFKEYNEQSHVFWVYGGSISRFYQGYKRIAQNLALPGWDDPDISILELVSKWLNEASSSYLLILDNADDMLYYWPNKYKSGSHSDNPEANLSLHLPEAGESRKVLITSRDSRIASRLSRPSKPVLLQHMSIEEAIELFRSDLEGHGSTATEAEMGKVAKALDCLPLAITQAASFIDENCISVSEYLTALEGDDAEEFLQEELDDSRRDEDSINSTFRSWKLSFELISKQKPRAAELLSLLGMLDRQSIPKWLVKMPEVVTSAGVLQSFSLIFCPEGSQIFQLHRLCQRFVRLWLKRSGQVQKWQDAALKCVSEAYPTVVGLAQWPVCDALAPHVATVLDYEYTSEEARLDLAHLLCWAADFDVERGMYHQALTRAEKSHGLFKELVLSTDQRLAASTWCHGRILYYEARSQSDLMQAREILQQGLNIADKSSWIYAECAYELAQSAYALGKREECLKMAKLNVDCWQRIEGMGDLRTLDIMHDYALALAMSGHRAEAISQWQEILDLYPKCNASADTKSIYMYRSMAGMAEFRGDASTAEILYAKLVALGSSIYGIQHIHVFDYRLSHAEQILRLNQPKKAFELCQSILRSCINKSEWRIPTTCYEIMAECCSIEHDDPGEEEWWLKAVDMHQRHSEGTQRRGMEVLEAAARCLLVNSKPQQAKKLLGQVFTWREAELSLDDSSTLDALELIGVCNAHQEQNDDAAADFTVVATHSPALNPRVTYNICTTLWNRQLWQDLEQRCSDALQEDQGSEFAPDLYQMQAVARGKLGRTEEALISKFKQLIDSTSRIKEGSRLLPVIPPGPSEIPPRFRRIIHPRTWSA